MFSRYLSQGFAAGLIFAVIAVLVCRRIENRSVRWGGLAAVGFASFVWAAVDLDNTVGYWRHLPDLGILWPPLAAAAALPPVVGEAAYRLRVRRGHGGGAESDG